MVQKAIHALIPKISECYLIPLSTKGHCNCDYDKDLEMERGSWISWVFLNAITCILIRRRQREWFDTYRQFSCRVRDWSDVATSKWSIGNHHKLKEAKKKLSRSSRSDGVQQFGHLDHRLVKLILNFGPPELKQNKFLLF